MLYTDLNIGRATLDMMSDLHGKLNSCKVRVEKGTFDDLCLDLTLQLLFDCSSAHLLDLLAR